MDNASALVSLYGDEATAPVLQFVAVSAEMLTPRIAVCQSIWPVEASSSGVPSLVVPCNECVSASVEGTMKAP